MEDRRSDKRVSTSLRVHVRGVDAQGVPFEEFTEAVNVSRRGLSILTRHDLKLFASLTLVIAGCGPTRPGERPTDFFVTGSVRRVEKEGSLSRVGIRFVGATLPTYTPETA